MTTQPADTRIFWQGIYESKPADSVSWYRPHLDASLELLHLAGISVQSRIIDIGGGASTLVDDLLDRGLTDVTVMDLSAKALAIAQSRIGERGRNVTWLVGDVLQLEPPAHKYDFWHDRAVFHFLTDPADAGNYAQQASRAVKVGGYAVIGGFAPDGPERCSGLPVARRSAQDIARVLEPHFSLQATRAERHVTPAGNVQSFAYALLKRQ
jgi:SAM-dependent methyltransferase